MTAVKNKIPDVNGLIKKNDFDTKTSEIEKKINDHDHDKYITTPEFNTMAASTFNARLATKTGLIRKPEFDDKLKGISDTFPKNKTKHLLVENELKKLKAIDISYFGGKNYFEGISDRFTKNKTKHLLVENELKKLKAIDISYFVGKNYFEGNDRAQNALVFQTVQKHFNLSNVDEISEWKSKGFA